MKIKFQLETLGSISAQFQIDNEILKAFHSADYGDKFQTLLNKFFSIYGISIEGLHPDFPYYFELLWEDDFINYLWKVKIDALDSLINIRIDELAPENPSYRKEILNQNMSKEEVFNSILTSLEDMIDTFGFIGYKRVWEVGNFPIFEYLILKSKKNDIKLKLLNEDNEEEEWKKKVSIEDEIRVIGL